MPIKAVVGLQWGDEGKGKIVDMITGDVDIVARYQGGANAGHTVVVGDQEYILHLIPSGILRSGKTCYIGAGVVVDPAALLEEIDGLIRRGVKVEGSLFISGKAHLIMPYHKIIDKAAENAKSSTKIGTTGRGIGPAYSDKANRIGIRLGDLFDPDLFRDRLHRALATKNALLKSYYQADEIDPQPIYDTYQEYAQRLRGYVVDCGQAIRSALREGKTILAEGAQGTMLDIDHGTYPFVTSSSSSTGGVCTGLGAPPTAITSVLGVMKAYTTRVGEGPFPTELHGAMGEKLRTEGGEFGATTGRPRRCGWLDALVGRYAVEINGVTEIALTKLDVLDPLDSIAICVAYEIDGKRYETLPDKTTLLEKATPVYETMPGWNGSTTANRDSYDALPDNAKRYIERVEKLIGATISIVSTGQDRAATIVR